MDSSPATLEVDVRRSSAQALLVKLETMMGVRLNLRRARVTSRRSWLSLEIIGSPDPSLPRPGTGF